ncbi:hypothetical protein FHW36_102713 [Chitinophaga polysaccharea]|uniref:Outer membrane protein with beta-barrel domain n=1 Tax=Chitinophaga polysaccharea TaxID=1293035 RepID=A0A561PXV0_9BACT|nr:hypothetical protein [Chitinophaga polysaccharea]TWF42951.1 hypothetical protein FHW36_102713 [Chitinophaga polysaccharea]
MKKASVFASLVLVFSVAAHAQQAGRHEVRIGYSDGFTLANDEILPRMMTNIFVAVLTGTKTTVNTRTFGVIETGYRFQLTKHIKLGADVAYQLARTEIKTQESADIEKYKTNYFIILPTIQFSYIKTNLLDFYGSAATGAYMSSSQRISAEKSAQRSKFDFAYQVNPVGLRVGRKLGGFVELGFGTKGFATAGISYKF